ncbi:glycosyltransferase family 39 protein [Mucilaginibacter sp. RB4R14]|uniref:ArnT family glycosyltransferase n=1 Tax=Mucilaginibacter aurantiaciroseus TaxID=2949308 RepID=UPI00209092CC|nr:glycosyltransferase family 39 protein [Mucilaginibacter aurantiaciroseus]MCO5935822.1 glycosyltransferase family 39 protein [Mucilaginibacter aurantiaciroseus]
MAKNYKPFYLLLFVLALMVNFIGINADFFTDDPGLYASIAKNMLYKHDVLQLFTYNTDWLDKPHFPFWAVLVSFKIFGVSAWAYRLPALLFFLLSLLYTYLFARRFYTKEIALTAVLILMTAQHILLSNLDIRAEPYLLALIIGSIYHIARYNDKPIAKHLLLAALLTACAIMTKGIFVIVAIYGALLGQFIFQKKFLQLFYPKWLLLYLLTFLFTIPEVYALYVQFDAHPEKTVFDRQNVSGIKWFLWDSQFGRFINQGPIQQKKGGDKFFFIHTLLWAYLPWCLLFYYALYKSFKSIWRKVTLPEYYTLSGGLLLLILFSLSGFQLPFYTNILFPLFAIITAPYCFVQLSKAGENYRKIVLLLFAIALPMIIIAIHVFAKPASNLLFITAVVLFGSIAAAISLKVKEIAYKVFMLTCCSVLFANFYLNTVFFPLVTSYNGQIPAARYASQPQFADANLYTLRMSNNSFQFYSNRPVQFVPLEGFKDFKPAGKALFFASQASVDYLTNTHADFKVVKSFIDYPQENMLPKFINSATRSQVISKAYLISK